MNFIDAVKCMDQGEVVVLDGDKFRIDDKMGIIEEYIEPAKDWLPTILTVTEYVSEDWEIDYGTKN